MPLSTEPTASRPGTKGARWKASLERWNGKLHFYSGLFLLFFLWLFAFSGLLLNHSSWTFTQFWENRRETNYEHTVVPPAPEITDDLGQARDILRQLGIAGEILWTTTRTNAHQLEFQARRPGHFFFIKADWDRQLAVVRRAEVNAWGIMRALHTFTGVQMDDPRNTRDWALTSVWAYSMDAVAVGLIFMVFSSWYMWLRLPEKRLAGAFALGLGALSCGLFCLGLRWLF